MAERKYGQQHQQQQQQRAGGARGAALRRKGRGTGVGRRNDALWWRFVSFAAYLSLALLLLSRLRGQSQQPPPLSSAGTMRAGGSGGGWWWPLSLFLSSSPSAARALCPLCPGEESEAEITTKALYDKIEFKNEEGGVWRQGWPITYQGSEWDNETLRVFVVPHSHNDPGWLVTVQEYYERDTRGIINTIVDALSEDPERKFIWEEMSYLSMWWEEADEEKRARFKSLVQSGQLEIVGGGWVMNDEANSHYFAIIDQITEGNTWLVDHVGVRPDNSWAIDPFGHSATMPYVLKRMGFRNMLIQRTHYETKKELARHLNLEFFWRQSWDRQNSTDMLCHMMPFYSYDVPHTCGPEPAVCCQFDFARTTRGFMCPWGIAPQEINAANVAERSSMIVDQWRKKSMLFRTNVVLVPLGDDFRYTNMREAHAQFENFGRLFKHINANPEYKTHASFGTLRDYFSAMRVAASRPTTEDDAAEEEAAAGRDASVQLPTLSGDFFTYADVNQDYWSGYYTSRPFWKAVDRVLEASLRASEILVAFGAAVWPDPDPSRFPYRFASELVQARRNLALFQHHDGVTGTAKDHVVVDYGNRMHNSLTGLERLMSAGIAALLTRNPSDPKSSAASTAGGDSSSVDSGDGGDGQGLLSPVQRRSQSDVLPEFVSVHVGKEWMRRVVAYNSVEEELSQVVSVVTDAAAVVVLDAGFKCVAAQAMPEWGGVDGASGLVSATGRHRIFWTARVPALGLSTYFLASPDDFPRCAAATLSQVEVVKGGSSGSLPTGFRCPPPYSCSGKEGREMEGAVLFKIQNSHLMALFSPSTGLLVHVIDMATGVDVAVEEEFAVYLTRESGAYLFLPLGPAQPVVRPGGLSLVSRGPLVEEALLVPSCSLGSVRDGATPFRPIVRTARVYNVEGAPQGSLLEMAHVVDMTSYRADDKELVVRYRTGVASGTTFHTDLNGFQSIRRETLGKIPTQANFYPMPAFAFLQSNSTRFSVHTRQAVGVASLQSGWLEMMLDRRLTRDDRRGLGQGVTDNHPTATTFHLLLESFPGVAAAAAAEAAGAGGSRTQLQQQQRQPAFMVEPKSASALLPSLLSHRVEAQLNYPCLLFVGRPEGKQDVLSPRQPAPSKTGLGRRGAGGDGTAGAAVAPLRRAMLSEEERLLRKRRVLQQPAGKLYGTFAPLRRPLPCDFHIVNMKLHRVPSGSSPVPTASSSSNSLSRARNRNLTKGSEPPIALLLQRRAWDCQLGGATIRPPKAVAKGTGASSECTVSSDGRVQTATLFGAWRTEGEQEFTLNLVKEAESSQRGQRRGKKSPFVLQVEPMEIEAVKFWWANRP